MPRIDATIHLGHLLQIGALIVSVLGAMATLGAWQARIEEKLGYITQRVDKLETVDTMAARDMQRLAENMVRLDATLTATTAAVMRLEQTINRSSRERAP
jgi:uncharacterized membrane-anchored protein